jgi:uncharacterized protein
MNLQERLLADLYEAMRAKDVPRREAIRMIRAAVKNAEIEWQRVASDQDVLDLIAREIKRRQEALEMFRRGRREDLVSEEEAGLRVLQQYLPQQLTRDQVAKVVQSIVAQLGASGPAQLGQVMREAMAQLKGKADGRLVNEVAREILQK